MGEWYSNILPAMFPIALLASAVYTVRYTKNTIYVFHQLLTQISWQGLLLAQLTLSHEKKMGEQAARLVELEAEVDALHAARQSKK